MFNNIYVRIIKKRKIWYAISAIIIIAGIISLGLQGLNLGIDFAGGNLFQIKFAETVSIEEVRSIVSGHVEQTPVIQQNDDGTYTIRTVPMPEEDSTALTADITKQLGQNEILRNELVGPTIGKELTYNAIVALIIASFLMAIYITIRFEFVSGVAAIMSLLHDAFVVVSVFSIFQLEVDSTFIAAILTVIGYSINATIIIFDRIRENSPNYSKTKLSDLVDDSVAMTMARSINTTFTTLLTLVALVSLGGNTTRIFGIALLVGILSGAYSSVFLSGSIWYDLRMKFGNQDNKSFKANSSKARA